MAEVVALYADVSNINSKESSSKLEEYFIDNLDRGLEVIIAVNHECLCQWLVTLPLSELFALFQCLVPSTRALGVTMS